MLSNACFCETLLNRSGVVPPLVLSIALLVDFLYPAKSEDALNQTEQNREGLACLLEWRIAADWIWGFHSKSKDIFSTRCWAPDQATVRALLSFFSIWALNLDTLNFRKIWVWILSTSGSEAPQAIRRHCGKPRREVCSHNRMQNLDLWFPMGPPPNFYIEI